MTVRKLDENGDIVTSGVQFITERDEIAQTVTTRLSVTQLRPMLVYELLTSNLCRMMKFGRV